MTFCYSIGITVGVYVVDFAMGYFGGLTKSFIVPIVLCVIGFVLEVIGNLTDRRPKEAK